MKKTLALVLAAMMLIAAFAGCSSQNGSKDGKPSGWVNDYFTTLPTTVNGFTSTKTEDHTIMNLTSIKLYREYLNETGDAYVGLPELAAELPVQQDEEGKVWRVTLRKGCKFMDGKEITADDIIFTYQMLLDPEQINVQATNTINSSQFALVGSGPYFEGEGSWDDVGIKKIDDYTLDFYSIRPVTQLQARRGIGAGTVLHKETFLKTLSEDKSYTAYGTDIDQYVSSGPFYIKEWIPDAKIVLERNPDFIYADKIKIEGINFVAIPDAQTALELFIKGDIDAVDISYEHWQTYEEDPRVHNFYDDSLMYMFINLGNPNQNNLLGKLNFREALYYGIDRVTITNAVGGEPTARYVRKAVVGDLTNGTPFVEMPGSNDYIDDPTKIYQPAKANEFFLKALEECNLTSATMELMYSETATRSRAIFEMMMVMLEENFNNKLDVSMRSVPAGQTITLRRWDPSNPTSFETTMGSLLPSADEPTASFNFFISSYSPPRFKYSDAEFDAMYEQSISLEANLNNDLKIELCQKMENKILKERIIVPVYETESKKLFADKIVLPTKDQQYITGYGFGYPAFVSVK
ncbi:MAG: hypothetical protein IKM67_02470 [Clostridia bacterium]|nr:hypothetical protein [Clostridia bacterium]